MKRTTWVYAGIGIAAAIAALAWAFAPRPVEVEVAPVTRGHFETSIEEDAKTRLRDRFVVSAPLAGLLGRITLREGDPVKADAVLATLTPVLSPMLDERTLREQQIRVETAKAGVMRADARAERARVALQQARNELQRSEQLARQGFVAQSKVDNDRLGVLAAEKELDAASEDRRVAAFEVEQARTALMAVQRNASSSARGFAVRAPVSGRVLRVVQASEGIVGLGAPLLEIGDIANMEIVAELLTGDALQARPGSRVVIERWGGPATLEGRVRLVEPSAFTKVSALGVEEQRVKVLIDVVSPADQWRDLGDGFRVGVRIVTDAVDSAVKVPVSAVFPIEEGGMAVFAVRDGRARRVPVEVAGRNGSEAWLRRGVEPGERVVVYPPASVTDGVRVKVRKA